MAMPDVTVRTEKAPDFDAIRAVNRLAFGGDAEARLVDRLRDGGFVRVSLVAEVAGRVVGHILFSELPVTTRDGAVVPALSLAPMAVLPEFQRQGVGSALVRAGLRQCRAIGGYGVVFVVGHLDFYPRFGFSAELARPVESPYAGEHFMALELAPGALVAMAGGRLEYSPPFEEV
jgi:putative acetyltransferase